MQHQIPVVCDYLTIILPRAQMGYELIAHEAEGRRLNSWSKKYRDKTSFAS